VDRGEDGRRRNRRDEPLPCAIIEPGDDAAAIEISMIENWRGSTPTR
jgi:hypothetical protein